jgi:hypothetical protein
MSYPVFEVSGQTSSINTGANFYVALKVGAKPVVLLNLSFAFGTGTASTAGNVTLFEGPTGLTAGSGLVAYSLDRVDVNTPTLVVEGGAGVTTPGTQVGASAYYRGVNTLGIQASPVLTHRLKANTNYVLRINNTDAAAQVADVYLAWYEGPDAYPVGV